jgi:hypothetical protein
LPRPRLTAQPSAGCGGTTPQAWTPTYETHVLPALRAMLALPFEHVLVSHGEPGHTRADFEVALARDPWSKPGG